MKPANMALFDLNLLRVFLAIWETRNLTAAGQQLGLTQPAVSHALRRLREAFNDPLFVRVPTGVLPTETATRLHGPLSEALRIIRHAVQDGEIFDAGRAQRVFRVAMSDVSEFYFLPALMGWLTETAPGVDLKVVPLDPAKAAQAMRAGEVDLTIGFLAELEEQDDIDSRYLFTDTCACLVRAGHPILDGGEAEPDLASLRYINANVTAPGHQAVERWLTEAGVKRQVALRLGHFMAAPSVVRDTDLAVIFPTSIATQMNGDAAFALLPLPPGHPVVDVRVHTHAHFRGDTGIRWLTDSLIDLFGDRPYPATT